MVQLLKVDKNGTKYFSDDVCPKCGGSGHIRGYEFIEGGRCFLCEGSGRHVTHWKEYTPEYAQKLAQKRLERAKKTAGKRNEDFMRREGFDAQGRTWIVTGDTYSIKDELKAQGAKFSPLLGWHFDHEYSPAIVVNFIEVTREWADGSRSYDGEKAEALIKALKAELTKDDPKSEYIGEIGQKVELNLVYTGYVSYTTHLTYRGETHYIHKFLDGANVVIWNTTAYVDLDEGDQVVVKATIKEHTEYKGVKQTSLVRAKITKGGKDNA